MIEYLQSEGNDAVFMGVGGSFDVISGNIPRAPLWVQRANLEWLFRVMQEPRRLFKRYFVGNWKFIAAIIKEKHHGKAEETLHRAMVVREHHIAEAVCELHLKSP